MGDTGFDRVGTDHPLREKTRMSVTYVTGVTEGSTRSTLWTICALGLEMAAIPTSPPPVVRLNDDPSRHEA
jgi:hypothetical protein